MDDIIHKLEDLEGRLKNIEIGGFFFRINPHSPQSIEKESPKFFVCGMMGKFEYASYWKSLNYIWNCYASCGKLFSFFP